MSVTAETEKYSKTSVGGADDDFDFGSMGAGGGMDGDMDDIKAPSADATPVRLLCSFWWWGGERWSPGESVRTLVGASLTPAREHACKFGRDDQVGRWHGRGAALAREYSRVVFQGHRAQQVSTET